MSLLYPGALVLIAAVGIPLLLHLRRRPSERRLAFPAVRYLRAAERAQSRALRLRDLLLMTLRIAALVALALAAAGLLIGRGGAGEHRPTDVAIVLDNSASTARLLAEGTVLEALRARAEASLELAGPQDRFWVYQTVGPPLALGVGTAAAAEAVSRVEATDGYGDIGGTVVRAASQLQPQEGRERELQLLTDLQASGFRNTEGAPVGVPIVAATLAGLPDENGALAEATLPEGRMVPLGATLFVESWPRRFPPDSSEVEGDGAAANLRLELDGATVDAATVEWEDRTSLRLPEASPGSHGLRVEIEPAGLRADDARFLSFRVVDPPDVRFRGLDDGYVAAALETLREAGRTGGGGPPVVLIESVGSGLTPVEAASESVVFVPPEDPLELSRFNQALAAAAVPWSLALDQETGELRLNEAAELGPSGAEVRIARRYLLRPTGPAPGDTALLTTTDGAPWLVKGSRPAGSYLLLASPLTPASTSIPTSPAMIPFVERLVLWSQSAVWPARDFSAGESLATPAGADSVRLPDGTVRPLEEGAPFLPTRAGLYLLYATRAGDDGMVPDSSHFAANVPALEFDPRPLAPADLPELFSEGEVVIAGPEPSDWNGDVFRSRRGHDSAPALLSLAVLLLLAETIVASPGRRDRADRPSPDAIPRAMWPFRRRAS